MAEKQRGSISFFTSFRPQVPLDIYSCPLAPNFGKDDEVHMTDGVSYNYNGQHIPPAALKAILNRPKLKSLTDDVDFNVNSGRVSGMVFVSERSNNLETLHISLRFNDDMNPPYVKVFAFADLYDDDKVFKGVRMEDRGCFAGDYIIYVSTKDDPREHDPSSRRQPWTAVYRTNLVNGKTDRLTPLATADLSPSVSPSGKMIAVASFESKEGGWTGEVEDLKTNIFVIDVEVPSNRTLVIKDGGWPTWGSDDILFFHRKIDHKAPNDCRWRVFRAYIGNGFTWKVSPVTPDDIYCAMTPAAINETTVVVATIRLGTHLSDVNNKCGRDDTRYYRHIEIFDSTGQNLRITEIIKPLADHYNPFVIVDNVGFRYIGYHRSTRHIKTGDVSKQFDQVQSPNEDVGVLRVSGVFPTFSTDGKKLAFVDRDFCKIWLADSSGLRIVYTAESSENCFCPAWNKDPEKDTLYICVGHSFHFTQTADIIAICNVSSDRHKLRKKLTESECSDAFPSSNPEGTKLVFRSTRDWLGRDHTLTELPKNLYIMEDVQVGEFFKGKITRLTEGEWIDTQCQWSPQGDWIVFSSNRDMPKGAPTLDNGFDPGYYAVYIVNVNHKDVVVRVMASGHDLAGRINYPSFSPDRKSIVVTSDLAAVSVDPVSLPLFNRVLKPYGDIFSIDIDPNDILKNKDLKKFHRITHSRYENATPTWTIFTTQTLTGKWNLLFKDSLAKISC